MAMGDALAVALLEARGFGADDFARSHPGGSLGRKLLTLVSDVMRQGDAVPKVSPETPFFELMREMSKKGLGMAVVVNYQDQVQGVFTDGDLRRLLEQGVELRSATAAQVMRTQPRFIAPQALAADAADKMEQHRITSLLVCASEVSQGEGAGESAEQGPVLKLVGTLHIGDLMRAKVI
jgi:arabinose-5-phosphate isomerase